MRNGITSIALTGWYSSELELAIIESGTPEEIRFRFPAGLSLHDVRQMKVIGINKPKISKRILIPAMVFKVGIFDPKITKVV
jgi:hypothetical protein